MLPPMGIWPTTEWNPVLGCSPADETCQRCYAAERISRIDHKHPAIASETKPNARFSGIMLKAPAIWEEPGLHQSEVIFACSMSDLMHPALSDQDIASLVAVMLRTHWSQFNVLTKRPERLASFGWPRNVRVGVSCGTQDLLIERWPFLRDLECSYRYLSVQPMLTPIVLPDDADGDNLSWAVIMREVGVGARDMLPEWAYDLRRQCRERGIAFAWEVTDSDSPACVRERYTAAAAGDAYVTQLGRR